MANDVMRLAYQFPGPEFRGVIKVFVNIGEASLEIGWGNDQRFIGNWILGIGNRKILAYGKNCQSVVKQASRPVRCRGNSREELREQK